MDKDTKEKFRKKEIPQLEKDIKNLELELLKWNYKNQDIGFHPVKGTPTTVGKKIKKDIAFLKTIIIERRKNKNGIFTK